jgi:hypothetical protein
LEVLRKSKLPESADFLSTESGSRGFAFESIDISGFGHQLIAGSPLNENAAAFCQGFQAGSDIDPVAVNSVIFLNNITLIHADPKMHPPIFRQDCISFRKLSLDFNSTVNGIYHTVEIRQDVVTRRIYDATPVLLDNTCDCSAACG